MRSRPVLWQWLPRAGLECFELSSRRSGWTLRGTIVTLSGRRPVEARYQVACDGAWRTKRCRVTLRREGRERSLDLLARNGRWYARGREIRSVRGAIDVDLGWSPSTNTLPIRRLRLRVGRSSGPLIMAWVRFPELSVEPLSQEYHRLSKDRYLYMSRQGSFTAELEVDRGGLVVDYANLWKRVPAR